jgi:amino acid transporter
MAVNKTHHADDVKRLAELGYKQQFDRKWSGFSNFAVSFSIISILSGCFTTFSQAWNNGGPVAISVGWPIIASLILIIGFCMAELVSAMPTDGWFDCCYCGCGLWFCNIFHLHCQLIQSSMEH